MGKGAKQMLHFVQHDTLANSGRLEAFFFLAVSALFTREMHF
jgi:hypothetical protein